MLYPAIAHAHVGAGATSGFAHGFTHPVTGLDHNLAMLLVGLLAFQMGGRALWLIPLAFVGMMVAGGALGMAGIDMPFVELGIALSVVALGFAVAFEVKLPVAAAALFAGPFAVFHGHAHGAEMPGGGETLVYGAGFIATTALLHIAGIMLGLATGKVAVRVGPRMVRVAGGVAALAGVGLLSGTI